MNTLTVRALAAGIGLMAVALVARTAVEAGPRPGMAESTAATPEPAASSAAQDKRAELMRLKLDDAKNVLEGLALEKMELVAGNARELKRLSAVAEWEPATVPGPLDLTYTREFQRLADSLAGHAGDGNLDAATLSYVPLTINCVDCYKYVRSRALAPPR